MRESVFDHKQPPPKEQHPGNSQVQGTAYGNASGKWIIIIDPTEGGNSHSMAGTTLSGTDTEGALPIW